MSFLILKCLSSLHRISAKDAHIMKTKIKELIPDREKGQQAIERLRDEIFTSVWSQSK